MSQQDEIWRDLGSFNPDMLILARNAAGLGQMKLGSLLKVGQNTISRWESGARCPSEDEVNTFSGLFGRPASFFYQPHVLGDSDNDVLFHRKKASTGKLVLKRLHARLSVARVALTQFLSSIETWNVTVPRIPVQSIGDGAMVAKRVRAAWNVPPGPIRDLFQLVEAAGVVVFRFDFGCREIDAIGVWPSQSLPLMFVNAASPTDRARFSVAHELAHLVMHSQPTSTMEEEADQFAGEFLFPTASAQTELQGVSTSTIWRAKQRWRVSGQAILRAALRAGTINENRYQSIMCYFSKQGWRRDEPYPLDPETPNTLRKIVDAFRNELGYSTDQIRTLTGLTSMEMSLLFGIDERVSKVSIDL
jgi:Zn-dependent peptidase ImmA (M78 family)/transcriptional regulator with XRE-family HTH domain